MGDREIDDDLDLYKITMTGEWHQVVEKYRENTSSAQTTKITKSGDTALHVAVSMASAYIVEKLVRIISDYRREYSILQIQNNEGNTPLHVAALSGRFQICHLLAQTDPSLVYVRNNLGETPLFLAAFHGHKEIFLSLKNLKAVPDPDPDPYPDPDPDRNLQSTDPYIRYDNETIFHCAIRWEYFDLACNILNSEGLTYLACKPNNKGIIPLHLLANKPSVFKSGCHLGWRKNIIYYCTQVHEEPKNESDFLKDQNNLNFPKDDETCIDFYDVGSKARSNYPENPFFQRCYAKCFDNLYLLFKILIRVIFGVEYEAIKKLKQKHIYSVRIMNDLIRYSKSTSSRTIPIMNSESATRAGTDNENKRTETGDSNSSRSIAIAVDSNSSRSIAIAVDSNSSRSIAVDSDCEEEEESPILLAVRNGITEMVEGILKQFPMAIHEKSSDSKNIVLLAVENRQPHVLQLLLTRQATKNVVKDKLIHEMDTKGNNALHLAAKLGEHKPWQIPGTALQMQWEIKWFAFVKNQMPEHFCYQLNQVKDKKEEKIKSDLVCSEKKEKINQTPEEIFNNTHEALVEQGGQWLIKTSESYSVVAALVATVAFAASTTIPGQINDKTGMPNLANEPGLTIFAISSLIALCFSITALFSFLAILTSRYQKKEFHRDLPMKLLLGLTSLFVSITSMLVSFCAGHFFTLKNTLRDMASPIYAATCLPIVFFAIAQFPLYFDILRATFKKMPQASYKAISL